MANSKDTLEDLPSGNLKSFDKRVCARMKNKHMEPLKGKVMRVCAVPRSLGEGGFAGIGEAVTPLPSMPTPMAPALTLVPPPAPEKPKRPRGRPKLPHGMKSKCRAARKGGDNLPGCPIVPRMRTACDAKTTSWEYVDRFNTGKREWRCFCTADGNKNLVKNSMCRKAHGDPK